MADVQHIIDQLREARDEISGRIAALIEERKPIDAALAALGAETEWKVATVERPDPAALKAQFAIVDAVPAATAAVAAVAERVTAKPKAEMSRSEKMKAAAAEMVECPECGVSLSKFGITTHRRSKHGVEVARTSDAERKAAGRTVLACSECDATFPIDKAGELSRHTITTHKRGPLTVERQPVAA